MYLSMSLNFKILDVSKPFTVPKWFKRSGNHYDSDHKQRMEWFILEQGTDDGQIFNEEIFTALIIYYQFFF